jgi:RND superfamily putative drug exporter
VRLADGSAQAHAGAGELRQGLGTAREGAAELPAGARRLAEGLRDGGARLGDLREPVGIATDELAQAWEALQGMTIGKTDPRYVEALESVGRARGAVTGRDPLTGQQVDPRYEGLDAALATAQREAGVAADGADRLAAGGDELVAGLARLEDGAVRLGDALAAIADGNRRLADALTRIEGGGARLAPGLETLAGETARLASGLVELDSGAGELASGLASGASRSGELTEGLGLLSAGVERQRRGLPAGDPSVLKRRSPRLFDSGYFYLASVDGTPGSQRKRARLVVSLDRGGHAARMSIIPTTGPLDEETKGTRERVEGYAADLAGDTGARVLVGGDQPGLWDYADKTRGAIPLATLALSAITLLVLVPVLRSLLLPLIAVLLNIVTVGATFGLLALLFDGALLGGPGYMDVVSVGSIVTVLFGLAIDYEVFVLARMREEYVRTGSTELAIEHGLAGTARVVTGAAIIMIAVFLAFATSEFFAIRVFGTGLAIGVFLDAFVIRLVALPAIMRVLGDRCWWLPGWLARVLPRVELEAPTAPLGRPAPAGRPA